MPVNPIDSASKNDDQDIRKKIEVSNTGNSLIFVNLNMRAVITDMTHPIANEPKKTPKNIPRELKNADESNTPSASVWIA